MTTANTAIKAAATSFLRLVASGQIEAAYAQHVAAGFRHHNPYFAADAASLKQGMLDNAQQHPGKLFEIQRAIEEGDMVAVHSKVRMNADHLGVAVVHIFRFEGDKIAELWDVGQAVPQTSPNALGMF